MGESCSMDGETRNIYKIWVRKPEGRRRFWRGRNIGEDNTKMDLRGIGLECVDWIHLPAYKDSMQQYNILW